MANLVFSSGTILSGRHIGAPVSKSGELVFCTGMVGYSEALTDPSYFGQILVFAYPLIGNYGFPEKIDLLSKGYESTSAKVSGVIVLQDSFSAHHWSGNKTLSDWLGEQNIPGIADIDTRALVHMIRNQGKILARIESDNSRTEKIFFDPDASNILPNVSTKEILKLGKGKKRIAIYDFGVKWNIVRKVIGNNCEVQLLPWDTKPESIDCDAWLLSNGPGDPTNTADTIGRIRKIMEIKKPILGICLGHQLLAIAAGAKTKKMNYGHRSQNQPVVEIKTKKAFMTTQNHGFEVEKNSLPNEWELWFTNANDESVEGICHRSLQFRGVQFHPEAASGPQDTGWIIDEFVSDVTK
jgi:carbamoyl-phosphate synthase small subunit